METRIGLPTDRGDAMLASIDRLGGRNTWGVQSHASGRHHADPGELLDRLIERVTSMLDDLLRAMSAASFPDAPAAPGEDFWGSFPWRPRAGVPLADRPLVGTHGVDRRVRSGVVDHVRTDVLCDSD